MPSLDACSLLLLLAEFSEEEEEEEEQSVTENYRATANSADETRQESSSGTQSSSRRPLWARTRRKRHPPMKDHPTVSEVGHWQGRLLCAATRKGPRLLAAQGTHWTQAVIASCQLRTDMQLNIRPVSCPVVSVRLCIVQCVCLCLCVYVCVCSYNSRSSSVGRV